MFHQKTGLLLQSTITALFFCLLLTHCCRGQSQVMGPSQPIVAKLGDDIILPSYLEPAYDATTLTVEWARPDLNPRFIYVSRSGHDLEKMKNPSYKGRTSMFIDELKNGNISLKISKVKQADAGRYRCYILEINEDTFMELVVVSAAVSQPVTTLAGVDGKGGVVLQCESAGWYPEPEVLWLDAEGNLLSAGPTETVRGPDDLYTVSSRVTVEKKHGNKFTCRVQQNNINQSRETWIHVPDDFFVVKSCSTSTTVSLAVCMVVSIILFILAVVVFVHTRRQNRTRRREDVQVKSEEEALMSMKTLEKEKQPESKRVNKEAEVSLPIDEERHQDQLKEEELKQKEDQRRNEAENTIQRLKEKLDMKKTEVENKQSELQRFQEEKKKIQEDLKNLIKDLDTKITKLKIIREELKSSWISFIPGSENQKKEDEKKRLQREIENLSKQLMTKKTEFQNKDEECEEKQVELKQLLDDQQKMETELQTEEQKLMKEEYDDIIKPLQLETEERKKAENEVKMLKNDLKEVWGEKEKLMETKESLLDEKLRLMETERKLKTEIQNMNKELDETDSQYPQWRHENTTVGNQPEELERNNSETNNQLQREKQKNETLNSRLEELEKKLKEKKLKWTETEETLKKELNQWTETERKMKTVILNMNKELQNVKKLTETEGKLKTGIQNMIQELEEMMRLMAGPITVDEVNEQDRYIRLKNISTEEIKLGGWELELHINSREKAMCTFHESVKLQAGESLTIWRLGFCTTHPDNVNLVWSELNKWRPEDKLQINIISNNGEIFTLL